MTPPETLADVLARLGDDPGLAPTRRRDLASALRTLARAARADPAATPATFPALRALAAGKVPAALGLSPKRWANVRADAAAALRHAGVAPEGRRPAATLPEPWRALRAAHGRRRRAALRPRPPGRLLRRPRDRAGGGRRRGPGGLPRLARGRHARPRPRPGAAPRLPGSGTAPPASSRAGRGGRWRCRTAATASACRRGPSRPPSSPTSTPGRRGWPARTSSTRPGRPSRCARRRSGTPATRSWPPPRPACAPAATPAELRGLADLVEPERLKRGLEFLLERYGGESTAALGELAATLVNVARHWVRLDAARAQEARADARQAAPAGAGPDREEPGPARPVRRPARPARPARAARQAPAPGGGRGRPGQGRPAGPDRAAGAAAAPGAAAHAQPAGAPPRPPPGAPAGPAGQGRRTARLVVPEDETKNGEPLEFPLPPELVRALDLYLDRHRATWCAARTRGGCSRATRAGPSTRSASPTRSRARCAATPGWRSTRTCSGTSPPSCCCRRRPGPTRRRGGCSGTGAWTRPRSTTPGSTPRGRWGPTRSGCWRGAGGCAGPGRGPPWLGGGAATRGGRRCRSRPGRRRTGRPGGARRRAAASLDEAGPAAGWSGLARAKRAFAYGRWLGFLARAGAARPGVGPRRPGRRGGPAGLRGGAGRGLRAGDGVELRRRPGGRAGGAGAGGRLGAAAAAGRAGCGRGCGRRSTGRGWWCRSAGSTPRAWRRWPRRRGRRPTRASARGRTGGWSGRWRTGTGCCWRCWRPARCGGAASPCSRSGGTWSRHADRYRLRLGPSETKNGTAYEAPLPASLAPWLDRYLEEVRPRLLGGRSCARLWVSRDGTAMTVNSLADGWRR